MSKNVSLCCHEYRWGKETWDFFFPFSSYTPPPKLMINIWPIHLWKNVECFGKCLVIIWSFLKKFLTDFILLKMAQVSVPRSVPQMFRCGRQTDCSRWKAGFAVASESCMGANRKFSKVLFLPLTAAVLAFLKHSFHGVKHRSPVQWNLNLGLNIVYQQGRFIRHLFKKLCHLKSLPKVCFLKRKII